MKVKRMGITEILRRIWLFSANKIKSFEFVSKQPTQLIIATEIRHNPLYFGSNETLIVKNGVFFHRGFMLYRVLFFCKRPFLAMFGQPAANSFCFYDPHHGLRSP